MLHSLTIIGTIALIHLFAAMSPGPDFILAVRNALTYSRRTGIYTAVGFALGIAVHLIYSAAGLALIISRSILLFNTIKMLGAAYLIFIGIKSLRAKSSIISVEADAEAQKRKQDLSPFQAIKMGFLTNALNPKATVFFLSLFTLVITPDIPRSVVIAACVVMVIDQFLWFSLVAIFFSHKKMQKLANRFQGVFNKFFGAVLVAMGVKVALAAKE